MQLWHAALIALFFGCGTYLIQQQSFVKVVFGFGLLGHAANMLILAMAGSPLGKDAPIVAAGVVDASKYVDPLPQALILTAIVIGFGLTAYLSVLLYRLFLDYRSTQVEDIYQSETAQRRAEALENGEGWGA
jgi:multicomponent Na+:H+ antiporter subunit C